MKFNTDKKMLISATAISIFLGLAVLIYILIRNRNRINSNPMKTSNKGIQLIKHFEGLHDGSPIANLQPEMDSAGYWTIGWGRVLFNKYTGKKLQGKSDFSVIESQYPEFLTITEQKADELLIEDIEKFEIKVKKNLANPIQQNKFDALVAHTYNTGGSNTLFSLINKNAPESEIQNWWTTRYITAGGVQSNGLIRRRKAEYHLFSTGTLKFTF